MAVSYNIVVLAQTLALVVLYCLYYGVHVGVPSTVSVAYSGVHYLLRTVQYSVAYNYRIGFNRIQKQCNDRNSRKRKQKDSRVASCC